MGRKAGALYINPKKFGGGAKPCMIEMVSFLNCLALNKQNDDKCVRQKDLLVACTQAQKGRPKNATKTINYHLQRLARDKGLAVNEPSSSAQAQARAEPIAPSSF
uniref:IMS import disulfide relay-system CHCH-CHCH-like Cx9C domain-containing protein n=1 Tax=Oryza meridionalis TaxID=40149 RepID=A0A0E0ELL1_9ORYZ